MRQKITAFLAGIALTAAPACFPEQETLPAGIEYHPERAEANEKALSQDKSDLSLEQILNQLQTREARMELLKAAVQQGQTTNRYFIDEAVAALEQEGNLLAAASVLQKQLNNTSRARDILQDLLNPYQYNDDNDGFARAASRAEELGHFDLASQGYEQAGLLEKAGDNAGKHGDQERKKVLFDQAMQDYRKRGLFLEALLLTTWKMEPDPHQKAPESESLRQHIYTVVLPRLEREKNWHKAAELALYMDDIPRVIRYYQQVGYVKGALEQAFRLPLPAPEIESVYQDGIASLLQSGKTEDAAELALIKGNIPEAINFYLLVPKFEEALRVALGNKVDPAEIERVYALGLQHYEKKGNFPRASFLAQQKGDKIAAALYLKANELINSPAEVVGCD